MALGHHSASLFDIILVPKSVIVRQKGSHKPSKRHLKNSIKKGVKKGHARHAGHAGRGGCPLLRTKKPRPDPGLQVQIPETKEDIMNTPLRASRARWRI